MYAETALIGVLNRSLAIILVCENTMLPYTVYGEAIGGFKISAIKFFHIKFTLLNWLVAFPNCFHKVEITDVQKNRQLILKI